MKTTTSTTGRKLSLHALFTALVLTLVFAFAGTAGATAITKADNATALGTGSSWTGGTAPGSGDVATWSGAYATAGSLIAALPGSALTWQGISLGSLSGTAVPNYTITAASESGTTVTITCATHGFTVGQTVVIAGVTPVGYNGTFTITGVPSATTFTYTTTAGLAAGSAFGTASAMISIGGTGSATALSALTIGTLGIDLSGANRSVVINSVTSAFSGNQTWNTAAGKVIRFGNTGTGGANAKVITSGSDGLIDISGSGIADCNQGGASGFADVAGFAGFAGKWRVNSGATLRGLRNGATAWGSSAAADAITLNGGTLAAGGISGAVGDWTWNSPITLATSTTSTIDNQNISGASRRLKFVGAFSGSGNLNIASTGAGTMNTENGFIFAAANSMSGTITIPSGVFVRVGGVGGNDATFPSGTAGTLGTAAVVNNGNLQLTHSDNFTFANTVSGSGLIRIGRSTGAENSGGVCTVSGNNSHSGGNIIMSSATLKLGHANAAGTGDISTGGSGSLDNGTGGPLTIANTLTMSGGGLTFVGTSDLTINGAATISGANRTLTVTAGTLTLGGGLGEVSGPLNFTKDGAGTLILTGNSSYTGTTTVSTSLGKLQIGNNGTAGTLASGAVTVTSATLSFKRSDNISIANTISGTGKLSQDGFGTTTLTGTLSYGGATTVTAGKMFFNTSATASAKTVSSGATLGGNNSIGAVTVNNGGIITAGNGSGVGTTTMSTLTLGATGTDTLTINVVPGAGGSLVAVATSSGLVNNGITTFACTGANLNTPGNYTVATYVGTLGGSGTWAVTLPPRIAGHLDFSTGGQINLVITGTDTIKWTGATDGNWDTTTTNWKEILSSTATTFINGTPGDTVTFDDTLTANPTVTINTTLTPAAVTVNNTTTTYGLTGTGKITGATTSLTKTGSGTFTLGNSGGNDYASGTTISAGTLALGTANALPTAGSVSLAGTLNLNANSQQVAALTGAGNVGNTGGSTPTLTIANGSANTFDGVIADGSGVTALTKSGGGTLTLTANQTYSGTTTVSAGTLEVGSGGATGSPGSGAIANSGTLRINRTGTLTVAGNITGAGSLTVVGNGDTTFSGSVANSVTISGNGSNTFSAAVSGAVSVTGSGSNVFHGAITGTTVTQGGTGIMYLDGANSYSGMTTISTGTLIAAGGSAIPDAGTVSVANGATFQLNASETVGVMSAVSNSTVSVQANNLTFATGTIVGNLTGSGIVTRTGTADTALESFNGTNALAFNGTLQLRGGTPSTTPAAMQGATGRYWLHSGAGSQLSGTKFVLDTGASAANGQDFIFGDWNTNNSRTLTLSGLTGYGTVRVDAGVAGTRNLIVDQSGGDTTFNGMLLSHMSGAFALRDVAFEKKGSSKLTMANIIGKETASSGAGNANVSITVTAGTLALNAVNTFTGPATVAGGATLQLGNASALGATGAGNDTTVQSGGVLDLNGQTIGAELLTLGGGTLTNGSGTAASLSGAVTLTNNSTVSGGITLSGGISGTGFGLTKVANGTLILGGINTYDGNTDVNAGTLSVNGTNAGAVTVASGATLGGSGTIGGTLTVASGGTLAPGNSIGTLTLSNSPSLSGTNLMEISAPSSSDKIVLSSGTLTYGGVLTVVVNGTAPTGGEQFDLFDATSFAGAFSETNLPSLGSGLNWWDGLLMSDGKLVVNRAPATATVNRTRVKGLTLKIKISDVVAACSDLDSGDAVTFVNVDSGITGSSVTTNSTNILYTPASTNTGADTLTYTVRDNRGGTATGSISITTGAVFGGNSGNVSKTSTNATVILSGIPDYWYSVQRATNSVFTLGVTNFLPAVQAPANGQITVIDDFGDLYGTPNTSAPDEAYYRLEYNP